jgi:outer membrane protein OmpA-like peptidoglycan-associated protein
MTLFKASNLILTGLLLSLAVTGCRKKPTYLTPLPAGATRNPKDSDSGLAIGNPVDPSTTNANYSGTPVADPNLRKDWPRDSEIFKSDTVYFDYDSSVVKSGEKSKVAAVAAHLKSSPLDGLEIDGHADERGTEEYNRALGERRALALREELIKLGIDAGRVDTVSFGKDKPADTGHTEAAHRKNRRGEFLLEMHPK